VEDNQLRAEVQTTFREVLNNPTLELTDDMSANHVQGWDSIAHIDLIYALEKRFKVRMTTGEVSRLANVGDLISLLHQKVK